MAHGCSPFAQRRLDPFISYRGPTDLSIEWDSCPTGGTEISRKLSAGSETQSLHINWANFLFEPFYRAPFCIGPYHLLPPHHKSGRFASGAQYDP